MDSSSKLPPGLYVSPSSPTRWIVVDLDGHKWHLFGAWSTRAPYYGHDATLRAVQPPAVGHLIAQTEGIPLEIVAPPDDLMTIADAARLVGQHPNTIGSAIERGQLGEYDNPAPGPNPRKGARLISRAQVLERWGK